MLSMMLFSFCAGFPLIMLTSNAGNPIEFDTDVEKPFFQETRRAVGQDCRFGFANVADCVRYLGVVILM